MAFDFRAFLERNGIEYVESGPNVKRGNINIHCVFCGSADPSHHMGIQLGTNKWACWRNQYHRGVNPAPLVAKLLGISRLEARLLVQDESHSDPSDFDMFVQKLHGTPEKEQPAPPKPLSFPAEFRPVSRKTRYGRIFWKYLEGRGFSDQQIQFLKREFKIRYCLSGPWRWRLIVPVYLDGRLVNWTGRSIRQDAQLRYLSLSHEESKGPSMPKARGSIKSAVLNFDNLVECGGRRLYLTEGPFDAMRLDAELHIFQMRATCLFSTSMSTEQRFLLGELAGVFDEVVVLMDPAMEHIAMRLSSELASMGAEYELTPQGIEDPGAMTAEQINELARAS